MLKQHIRRPSHRPLGAESAQRTHVWLDVRNSVQAQQRAACPQVPRQHGIAPTDAPLCTHQGVLSQSQTLNTHHPPMPAVKPPRSLAAHQHTHGSRPACVFLQQLTPNTYTNSLGSSCSEPMHTGARGQGSRSGPVDTCPLQHTTTPREESVESLTTGARHQQAASGHKQDAPSSGSHQPCCYLHYEYPCKPDASSMCRTPAGHDRCHKHTYKQVAAMLCDNTDTPRWTPSITRDKRSTPEHTTVAGHLVHAPLTAQRGCSLLTGSKGSFTHRRAHGRC